MAISPKLPVRISREELNMQIAELISKRSTCNRRKVGCVITTSTGRIISSGYNGSLDGHCTPENCNEIQPCKNTVHAEANAIAAAASEGIATSGTILYCTDEPCVECAKLIIQSGIFRVYYRRPYRLHDGLQLLRNNHIDYVQI